MTAATAAGLRAQNPALTFSTARLPARFANSFVANSIRTPGRATLLTGMIGPGHLGGDRTGFAPWTVLPRQSVDWNPQFLVAGRKLNIEGHCTDITIELDLEWFRTPSPDHPFFLILHHKTPHHEWAPATRHLEMVKGRVIPEPDTLGDSHAARPTARPETRQTIAAVAGRRSQEICLPA